MCMPYFENCPHSETGWCLLCVAELGRKVIELEKQMARSITEPVISPCDGAEAKKEKCPFCGSENVNGVEGPMMSLDGKHGDVEQLSACADCLREYVACYKFSVAIPVNQSSRYEAAA